jgi:hypothetical protein
VRRRVCETLVIGGKDRHFCIGVTNLAPLIAMLEREAIPYTVGTLYKLRIQLTYSLQAPGFNPTVVNM